jgi:cobalt/nickel transport system permease protein
MHIADGVLAAPVLAAGAALAAGGLAYGLRRLPWERVMDVAILSSAFFVASLIHIQIGVGSVHLILNGLLGAVLGWACVPAVFIALLFQCLLFQFGGLAALGVNTCTVAGPALLFGLICRPRFQSRSQNARIRSLAAFCCGALSVAGSAVLAALALVLSGDAFAASAVALLTAHVPVMLIEGLITAIVVNFLARARPELLGPALLADSFGAGAIRPVSSDPTSSDPESSEGDGT